MRTFKCLLVIVSILLAAPALAFDEHRQGFVLGFGAGLHTIDIDFIDSGSTIASQSKSGLATSLKIGGGITNQFALYYVRNASWYSAPYSDGFTVKDITYVIGITGIGASYFFSPSAPSAYLLAATGVGDITAPFESGVSSDTGSAYMFGAGYEFSNHAMFEATLLSTKLDSADISTLSVESSSLQITLNYVFY